MPLPRKKKAISLTLPSRESVIVGGVRRKIAPAQKAFKSKKPYSRKQKNEQEIDHHESGD